MSNTKQPFWYGVPSGPYHINLKIHSTFILSENKILPIIKNLSTSCRLSSTRRKMVELHVFVIER
jgi:hypothetical protein